MGSSFSFDRNEMIAHSVHLQGVVEKMDQWPNPGVGSPDDFGNLVGSQVIDALTPLGDQLYGVFLAARNATHSQMLAVRATAEAYSQNEEQNRQLAQRLNNAMGGK